MEKQNLCVWAAQTHAKFELHIEIAWMHCTPDHGVYLSNFTKSYHHQIAKLAYMVEHGLHDTLQSLSLDQLSASAHQNSH